MECEGETEESLGLENFRPVLFVPVHSSPTRQTYPRPSVIQGGWEVRQ